VKYVLMTTILVATTLNAAAVNGELEATGARSCESLASLTLPTPAITLCEGSRCRRVHAARASRRHGRPAGSPRFAACRRSAVWQRR